MSSKTEQPVAGNNVLETASSCYQKANQVIKTYLYCRKYKSCIYSIYIVFFCSGVAQGRRHQQRPVQYRDRDTAHGCDSYTKRPTLSAAHRLARLEHASEAETRTGPGPVGAGVGLAEGQEISLLR